MNWLADLHHDALYESICLLAARAGATVYRPIGPEWADPAEPYWAVFPHPATVAQYLGYNQAVALDLEGNNTFGEAAVLNKTTVEDTNGIYTCVSGEGKTHRAMTLERAKTFGFDVLISSMPQHFPLYENFRQRYCPSAKHVFQSGNIGWTLPAGCVNFLNSTSYEPPTYVHHVRYHQEFSLKKYRPQPLENPRSICSLLHLQSGHFPEKFRELRGILQARGWVTRNYGAGNDDGPYNGGTENALNAHGFLYHVKKHGDGFGHSLFNAAACGRPIVYKSGECAGQIATELFDEGTAIDIEGRSMDYVATRLEEAAADYANWHARVIAKFVAVVNFDQEFEQLKHFFNNLR